MDPQTATELVIDACECTTPRICPIRDQWVSKTGIRICQAGDPAKSAKYFKAGTGISANGSAKKPTLPNCRHLGDWIREETGIMKMNECTGCAKTVRLKVYECAVHRETTLDRCAPGKCQEYEIKH